MEDYIIQDEFTPSLEGVLSYDFKIPEYTIPNLDMVAEQGVVPSNPLEEFAQSAINYDKTNQKPLGYVSAAESKRYNDPFLSYTPGADNEDLYAKIHPFTWGDSLSKMGNTLWDNKFSGFLTATSAIKGFAEGKGFNLWENDYTKELAIMTRELEEKLPQYKTAYDRENPLTGGLNSTLKSIFPAVGTVASSIIEAGVTNAVLVSITGLTGGVTSPLLAANLLKDGTKLSKAFKGIYDVFRASDTVTKINKHKRLVLGALYYANGEAALQGSMNAHDFYEKEMSKYLDTHGQLPSGQALADIKKKTQNVGAWTYGANMTLLMGSNIKQFPSLMRGKVNKSIMDNLPVKFINGKLEKKSNIRNILTEIGKDGFTEGFEEWGQGAIDEITKDYYSGRSDKSAIDSIFTGISKKLNKEGFIEFLGGALIGGPISGGGAVLKGIKQRAWANEAISGFNTTTGNLLENFKKQESLQKDIDRAFEENDSYKIDDKIASSVFELVKTNKRNHTIEAYKEYFKDFSNMENEAFREFTKLDLDENQQAAFTNSLLDEVTKAEGALGVVEQLYRVNPYLDKPFYKRLNNEYNPFKTKSIDVWEDFKAIQALKLFKKSIYQDQVQSIREELEKTTNPALLNTNFKQAIKDWKENNLTLKVPTIEGIEEETKAINKRDSQIASLMERVKDKSPLDQFFEILEFDGVDPELMLNFQKKQSILDNLVNEIARSSTEAGEKKLLKDIFQYKAYSDRKIVEKPVTEPVVKETPKPKVEETYTVEKKEVKETKPVIETTAKPKVTLESLNTVEPVVPETIAPTPAEPVTKSSILDTDAVKKRTRGILTNYTPPKGNVFVVGEYIAGEIIKNDKDYFISKGIDKDGRELDEQIPIDRKNVSISTWDSLIEKITDADLSDKLASKPIMDLLGLEFVKKKNDIAQSNLERFLSENPDANKEQIQSLIKAGIVEIIC